MNRRGFLSRLAWLLPALAAVWPMWSFISWRGPGARVIRFAPEEMTAAPVQKDGVYLMHEHGNWLALSRRCPHLGCSVAYDSGRGQFVCPCHRSRFGKDGRRLAGPANTGMTRLPCEKLADGGLKVRVEP